MIIDREQEGLFIRSGPPLVDGGIMLPQLAEAGAFPATASFGTPFWEADEVGEMSSDKGGDRFAVALEAEADFEFIGDQLEVGRFLQRDEVLEELAGLWRPIGPVISTGNLGAESRAAPQPARAEAIEVSAADLERVGRVGPVDFPCIELLEDLVKKGCGKAFGQLFFSQSRVEQSAAPWSRVFVGLRYAPASSNPRPGGHSPKPRLQSPFERAAVSFCSRPDREIFPDGVTDARAITLALTFNNGIIT